MLKQKKESSGENHVGGHGEPAGARTQGRARHHPPQSAETSEPVAGRRSRRPSETVRRDRGRSRDPGSGADRHRPCLQRRLRSQLGERAVSAVEERSAGSAFEAVVNRLEDIGLPTICRLNGGVYGGSTDLALACDFRIGVDTCEMFMPAARLGLHYYKSGIARYVARLGVDNAKKLFLTAEKIGAAEMLRIGYLTAVVPAEALDEEVDRLAIILAGNAPVAMRGMKRTINEFARGELDEAAADRRHRESMRGDEIKEGIKAFSEKRPPKF
jgi:enoyl-CoA hydratase/carnithine racemase